MVAAWWEVECGVVLFGCIATISHPPKLLVVCELITTQGKHRSRWRCQHACLPVAPWECCKHGPLQVTCVRL